MIYYGKFCILHVHNVLYIALCLHVTALISLASFSSIILIVIINPLNSIHSSLITYTSA